VTVVRNRVGKILPCCWDDCERAGHTQFEARVPAEPIDETEAWMVATGQVPQPMAIYVFCSVRHKMLWVNSHRDNGNLPAGYRGTLL